MNARLRCIAVLALAIATGTASAAQDPKAPYRQPGDTASDIAQLPKYCYPQYVDSSLKNNPEFAVDPTGQCGEYMNHLCPGLMNLIHAQRANLSRGQRLLELDGARTNLRYTLNYMKPGCVRRNDVLTAMERIRVLESLLKTR